jgi:predicted nucleotidyltransferase
MKRLEGKNRIRRFRQIAKALTSKIIAYKGVAGVVYIGGLVRGFADRHSDVDIIVLLNEKNEDLREKIKKIGSDTQKCSFVDIDLEIHSIEDFRRREWGEIDKWDFSRAEIVFDADGETLKLLREKTRVSESFWTKRIVVCGEYLKWYCCPPKEDIGTMVELWIERGDLASAHYCLNYALDLLIRMIFALNREFLPAPKWRIFYSHQLEWLPKGYEKLLQEAMTTRSLSTDCLNQRLRALRIMWREILPKIRDKTGLTPDLISKLYVRKVLHQT